MTNTPQAGGVPARLFAPRSIAVVGASADPSKLGYRALEYLRKSGFPGNIYPVNPKASSIQGLRCYCGVADMPEVPDLAFLVVPGAQAVEAAKDCAAHGVAAAIVAATGFAEAGPEGVLREQVLAALTRSHGIRFVGPNTNGIYSTHTHLSLGYNAAHAESFDAGPVSLVSHSGALFSSVSSRMKAEKVGLAKFVAVGNEADLTLLDFFDFMVDDPRTEVILLLVEALGDGARFRSIARRARGLGKRVIALKLGTSHAGAASTQAHSSRMAGSARAYAALFESAGVAQVHSLEGLVACARLCLHAPQGWAPRNNAVGIVTASGGGGTLVADLATQAGLGVATLSAETTQNLEHIHGSSPGLLNPLDVTAVGGTLKSAETIVQVAVDPAVDATLGFLHVLPSPAGREAIARALVSAREASRKPTLVLAPGALPAEQADILSTGGVPVFADSGVAVQAVAGLMRLGQPLPAANPVCERAKPLDLPGGRAGALSEFESMRLLEHVGIACIERAVVPTCQQALDFAARHDGPVVLKGMVEGVAHKSDLGLVHLRLDTPGRLQRAWDELHHALATHPPGSVGPVVIQRMAQTQDIEFMAGFVDEEPLGRFLVFGIGGRHAEAVDMVALVAMPATPEHVRSKLVNTQAGRVLASPRWGNPASVDAMVDVLMRLQTLSDLGGPRLQAVEINPLHLGHASAIALDALAVIKEDERVPGRHHGRD